MLLTNSAVSRPFRQPARLLALLYFILLNGSAHRSTGWKNYGPHDHGTAISVVSRRYPCPGNKHGWYKWLKKWIAIKRDWSKSRKGEVLSGFYRAATKITWIHAHTTLGRLTILNVCVFWKKRKSYPRCFKIITCTTTYKKTIWLIQDKQDYIMSKPI